MKKQIEILAPAGSYDGMRAAMNAGCDAVYIGGSSFGARAYANNLNQEALLEAIDEAHIRNKRLYLTVNTLVKERELEEELYQFLEKFYLQGLDAVIVQDLGVMRFIHQHFPKLPIHASTQMTLTMAQGSKILEEYGVTRIVTSRELSLKEIAEIRNNTTLELETFVHGALCYCYSGQCLMSSVIGGRSGNRGRCAQPCRMPYTFYSGDQKISSDRERYLLSPKDINTVALLPKLVEAGIDSFKIEGRMKRPEYAAAVAHIYRKYLDLYFELGEEAYDKYIKGQAFQEDMTKLLDVFNRGGFSQGYGLKHNGKSMMAMVRPNHSGVYVGDVTKVTRGQVTILLKERVNAQDVLELRAGDQTLYEFTVKNDGVVGDSLVANIGKTPMPTGKYHIQVYRTKNQKLLEQLSSDYINQDSKQRIRGILRAKVGEALSLTIHYLNYDVKIEQEIVQKALKQPMTKEKLLAPIYKTGDTLFYFDSLELEADEDSFVPVAWLNEIRRAAISKLMEVIVEGYKRNEKNLIMDPVEKDTFHEPDISSRSEEAFVRSENNSIQAAPYGVCVYLKTREQFEAAICFDEVGYLYVEYDTFSLSELTAMAEKTAGLKKAFYLVSPHICRISTYRKLEKEIGPLMAKNEISGFVVKNLEEVELIQKLNIQYNSFKEIVLNHNLYVFNQEAIRFWREQGITRPTAPVELNYQELKTLGIRSCDLLVYGYLPLMVSAQCLYESTEGCSKCRNGEQNKAGFLEDRMGKKFFVQTNCNGCYNTIYNGQCLSLLKHSSEINSLRPKNIRLDFTLENARELERVLKAYIDSFLYGKKSGIEIENYTTIHFKRGIE